MVKTDSEVVAVDPALRTDTGRRLSGTTASSRPARWPTVQTRRRGHRRGRALQSDAAKNLPPDEFITRTVKTDTNGVVTCSLPDTGWWCLTASRSAGERDHEGKEAPCQGAHDAVGVRGREEMNEVGRTMLIPSPLFAVNIFRRHPELALAGRRVRPRGPAPAAGVVSHPRRGHSRASPC